MFGFIGNIKNSPEWYHEVLIIRSLWVKNIIKFKLESNNQSDLVTMINKTEHKKTWSQPIDFC